MNEIQGYDLYFYLTNVKHPQKIDFTRVIPTLTFLYISVLVKKTPLDRI